MMPAQYLQHVALVRDGACHHARAQNRFYRDDVARQAILRSTNRAVNTSTYELLNVEFIVYLLG